MLKTQETARRVLAVKEFRELVEAMDHVEISAIVAVMGETGIRKGEAIQLCWDNVNFRDRILTVGHTKNRRVRHVPLSAYAIEWLRQVIRYVNQPRVFVSSRSDRPWVNPEGAFNKGAQAAGLDWVGFHDLRRFRATQWVKQGVDVRTVKELLGHRDIQTTMRYAMFVTHHGMQSIRAAEKAELGELEEPERVKNG